MSKEEDVVVIVVVYFYFLKSPFAIYISVLVTFERKIDRLIFSSSEL